MALEACSSPFFCSTAPSRQGLDQALDQARLALSSICFPSSVVCHLSTPDSTPTARILRIDIDNADDAPDDAPDDAQPYFCCFGAHGTRDTAQHRRAPKHCE